jgi:diguanylate cyclase (GGDEF)-like protein/PAS domain S-box-containing protein
MTQAPGARILVVDDRPTNRAVLKAVLRPPLYQVTEAAGGHSALALVANNAFDLIILDLLMPDLNGLEVLKTIRKTHSASALPVIMVTVKDEGSGVVEALESGANDYISRPIDFPVLFARIQAQLSRKRMEDALRDAQEDLERRIEARTAELINTNRTLKAEISERKRVEDALRASEERFKDFAQTGADWFWEMGPDLRFTYLAGRYFEALGLERRAVLGRTREEVHAGWIVDAAAWEGHCQGLKARCAFSDFEFTWVRPDGKEKVLRISGKPIFDASGIFQGYRGADRDITETHHLAQQMAHQATHDALTGLENRREFERQLEQALASARSERTRHALCYLDLDQFKLINDSAGHVVGDQLLRQVAGLLLGKLRACDTLARLGGDEFSLLIKNCSLEKALEIAEDLLTAIRDFRFSWEGRNFEIGGSIGLVPITADAENTAKLLSQADVACYTAKELGRNRVYVYETHDSHSSRLHTQILRAAELTDALEKNRFRIYGQPIVGLPPSHERPMHIELLLRMLDAEDQLLLAGEFIPAAERYGLMRAIDRWVIRTVLQEYGSSFARLPTAKIAINLSGNSLNDDSLLAFTRQAFGNSALPPQRVCFEITETAAIDNLKQTSHFILEMKKIGCCFALDDFGSGLSSFAYLKNLPVDYLKIDGNFVRDMVEDTTDQAMVAAINQVGHTMGIQTVAEYAESAAVIEQLRKLGVDYAQGYGIGRPQPIEEFWGSGAETYATCYPAMLSVAVAGDAIAAGIEESGVANSVTGGHRISGRNQRFR